MVPVRLLDLREYRQESRSDAVLSRTKLPGDPLGDRVIDLRARSCFNGHAGEGRYYGADYDRAETNAHHTGGRHEYRLAETPCAADVFISLPKMKTHKKAGVTLGLKNLVGITTGRNWLPHYADGAPEQGGDQFPARSAGRSLERGAIRLLQTLSLRSPRAAGRLFKVVKSAARPFFGGGEQVIRSGNWHGNDTAWRMVLDINRAFHYSGLHSFPAPAPRRSLTIVDGIIGGEGNGPLEPDPVPAGVLLAGLNPLAVDTAAAHLMGFDFRKMPMLLEGFRLASLPLAMFPPEEIRVRSDVAGWDKPLLEIPLESCFRFRPHFGWTGWIERAPL
jgi:hypothetical protein